MTDRRLFVLLAALTLGLGEWFSVAHMGSGRPTMADWLIAILVGGPAFALWTGLMLAVPCVVIATLKWHR